MPEEEVNPFEELRKKSDKELEREGFSRGEILAIRDDMDAEKIMDTFGTFYTMELWRQAMKSVKSDKGESLTGKTFKVAFGEATVEVAEQFSPYEYYGFLKEGVQPDIQRSRPSELIERRIKMMEKENKKRMDKGKNLKHAPDTIIAYEEALDVLLEKGF